MSEKIFNKIKNDKNYKNLISRVKNKEEKEKIEKIVESFVDDMEKNILDPLYKAIPEIEKDPSKKNAFIEKLKNLGKNK